VNTSRRPAIDDGRMSMNATKTLHEAGQSLWLDNLTR
jgi:hypothetical protein